MKNKRFEVIGAMIPNVSANQKHQARRIDRAGYTGIKDYGHTS